MFPASASYLVCTSAAQQLRWAKLEPAGATNRLACAAANTPGWRLFVGVETAKTEPGPLSKTVVPSAWIWVCWCAFLSQKLVGGVSEKPSPCISTSLCVRVYVSGPPCAWLHLHDIRAETAVRQTCEYVLNPYEAKDSAKCGYSDLINRTLESTDSQRRRYQFTWAYIERQKEDAGA